MKDLLKKLREEHQLILHMLDHESDFVKILDFVEKVHHPKEEQELFPGVANEPWLSHGGPLCTYYRGIQLEFSPIQQVKAKLEKYYADGGPRCNDYAMPSWCTPQNPLSIPMEEHAFGHELSHAIRYLCSEQGAKLYGKYFKIFKQDYEDFLRQHIAKEDGCLFKMCERRGC
ncbi:hypothetical protein ACLSU7_06180 [Bdellovibrio sp. HCB185ZH]|uniref:hypothetical protein n=1 Tax=Bdellovibrio sp. HCB185ZH TaxID=3394235 RepID=UPI0039A5436B